MQTSANGSTAPQLPPPPPIAGFIRNPVFNTPVEIALDTIVPGQNPRKTFDDAKLVELAESFKAKGQLQPIKVRQVGTKKELVFGERRVRAARLAGWQTIMAYVVDLSDSEALEEALLENGARADVDEYEEAEAFRQLRDKHHRSAEEIAAKVGKSLATIYARLKLAELDGKARELARDLEIPPSTALLAARIVGAERQRAAMQTIGDDRMSYREAQEFIQRDYMLALADAPFDTTDADLVPKAGSCAKCPKRTGNQPALFHDVKSKDICTDASCFKSKEDAVWKIRAAKAKADGQEVLSDAESKNLFEYGGRLSYSAPFKALDGEEWTGTKSVKVKTLLGKNAPPPVLARTPDGKIVELVPKAVVEKKLKELRPDSGGARRDDSEVRREAAHKLRKAVVALAMPQIVEAGARKKPEPLLRHVVEQMIHGGGYSDAVREAVKRRGIEPKKTGGGYIDNHAPLLAALKKFSDDEVGGLVVELLCAGNAAGGGFSSSYTENFERAAAFAGLDIKEVEAEAKKAAAEKKAAKSKPSAAPCAVPGCGEPGTVKTFCASHAKKLTAPEQKSILARNKKLAAEGSVKKLPAAKPAKAKKK